MPSDDKTADIQEPMNAGVNASCSVIGPTRLRLPSSVLENIRRTSDPTTNDRLEVGSMCKPSTRDASVQPDPDVIRVNVHEMGTNCTRKL